MTRKTFTETMDSFGFNKVFESWLETVWKKGKNQIELFNDGKILFSRGTSLVVTIPLKTLDAVYAPENTYPETLVFASANGVATEFSLCR